MDYQSKVFDQFQCGDCGYFLSIKEVKVLKNQGDFNLVKQYDIQPCGNCIKKQRDTMKKLSESLKEIEMLNK